MARHGTFMLLLIAFCALGLFSGLNATRTSQSRRLESCEDFEEMTGATFADTDEEEIASASPYCNDMEVTQFYEYSSSAVVGIYFEFSYDSEISEGDILVFSSDEEGDDVFMEFSGDGFCNFTIPGKEFYTHFSSDEDTVANGYIFWITPLGEEDFTEDSDMVIECESEEEEDEEEDEEEEEEDEEDEEEDEGDYDQESCEVSLEDGRTEVTEVDSIVVESSHNYCNDTDIDRQVVFTDESVVAIMVEFSEESHLEEDYDFLTFYESEDHQDYLAQLTDDFGGWSSTFVGNEINIHFTSDGSVTRWGFHLTITPLTDYDEDDVYVDTTPCMTPEASSTELWDDSTKVESRHPYCNDQNIIKHFYTENGEDKSFEIDFSCSSELEDEVDILTFSHDEAGEDIIATFTGDFGCDYFSFTGSEFYIHFETDDSTAEWGFKFWIYLSTGNYYEEYEDEESEDEEREEALTSETGDEEGDSGEEGEDIDEEEDDEDYGEEADDSDDVEEDGDLTSGSEVTKFGICSVAFLFAFLG